MIDNYIEHYYEVGDTLLLFENINYTQQLLSDISA